MHSTNSNIINIKATFPQNCNAGKVKGRWEGVSRLQSDAMQHMRKILRAPLRDTMRNPASCARLSYPKILIRAGGASH